jgi:hypothetical protein
VWRGRSGWAGTGVFQARAAAVFVAAAAVLLPTAGIAIDASPAPASALGASPSPSPSPVPVATAAFTSGVQVDAAVRREMEALRIPGLALAIVRDGAVAPERGHPTGGPA